MLEMFINIHKSFKYKRKTSIQASLKIIIGNNHITDIVMKDIMNCHHAPEMDISFAIVTKLWLSTRTN